MNGPLEVVKPEISVEERTEVHKRIRTICADSRVISVERAERKRNYRCRGAEHRFGPLKVLESVLLPSIIIFYSLITALSATATNPSLIVANRYTQQDIELLRKAFLKKLVFFNVFKFRMLSI